ncbi:MAG: MOSC N-terminal beta barrel domain-containing protein [Bacteroidia bacterium]|nr:MOSC N-terminal beta barrel domain-containing protein [Bacteroidia bacterium]
MSQAYISKIRIYPIKSLDPVEVENATAGIRSLKNDRRFAIVDQQSRYVNGKRTGHVNQLEASYELEKGVVNLSKRNSEVIDSFELREGNQELNKYLSDFFGLPVRLLENGQGEFMDIPGASSITIVSEASLLSLHKAFPSKSLEDLRLRFRTNIELSGLEPFEEEKLFDAPGKGVQFRLGDVRMIGISPRARCNVPPRNPLSGELEKDFVRKMMDSRDESLPADSKLPLHGRNTYYLTVNSYLPATEMDKTIRIGDKLELSEVMDLQKL